MKNYLKSIIIAGLFFSLTAACTDNKEDDEIQEQLYEMEATDGSEVKRPGGA
jgi:hypothetical protein